MTTKRERHTFLWKIEGAGEAAPSFVLGTMHLPGLSLLPCAARVRQLIEQCEVLACELDLSAALPVQPLWPGIVQWSLRAAMPAAHYEKLRRMLYKAFGVDVRQFDHVPPLWLMALLSRVALDLSGRSLDEELWQLAQDQGKMVIGLEQLETQWAILRQIPLKQQLRELKRIARHPAGFRRRLRKRRALYLAGEIQLLYRLVRKEAGRSRHALIDEYNKRMAACAWPLMQGKSVLIAVGAAHLPGHNGLLRLFKQRGAHVVPLPWHACDIGPDG